MPTNDDINDRGGWPMVRVLVFAPGGRGILSYLTRLAPGFETTQCTFTVYLDLHTMCHNTRLFLFVVVRTMRENRMCESNKTSERERMEWWYTSWKETTNALQRYAAGKTLKLRGSRRQ